MFSQNVEEIVKGYNIKKNDALFLNVHKSRGPTWLSGKVFDS